MRFIHYIVCVIGSDTAVVWYSNKYRAYIINSVGSHACIAWVVGDGGGSNLQPASLLECCNHHSCHSCLVNDGLLSGM